MMKQGFQFAGKVEELSGCCAALFEYCCIFRQVTGVLLGYHGFKFNSVSVFSHLSSLSSFTYVYILPAGVVLLCLSCCSTFDIYS